jgi:hypothetical protein
MMKTLLTMIKEKALVAMTSTFVVFLALTMPAGAAVNDYRPLGYMYLSPEPYAEYTSTLTRYVLVRFYNVAPTAITNLSTFITVTGANSGDHAGQTQIASDGRTVIFTMTDAFQNNELVTVSLNPQTASGTNGTLMPYSYRFMVGAAMASGLSGVATARGENPPNETAAKAFDGLPNTKWMDFIVPDGSAGFSWLQLMFTGAVTHVVNQYAITSATNAPERDPKDWRLYGIDASSNLVVLDVRTNQTFSNRSQRNIYTFTNSTFYRGYRLEITRVNDPNTAAGVQLADLELVPASGSVLYEYWTGIAGTAISDLKGSANYPNNPSGSYSLSSLEGPTDWADNYGSRTRGYITAPDTGAYVFWLATDDDGELWLSTDSSLSNAVMIASVNGWTSSREWNKYSSQKSAPITLVAGQKYYIEALQKESGGGDNIAVGWARPGQSTSAPFEIVPGEALSPWTENGASIPSVGSPWSGTDQRQTPASPKVAATPGHAGIMPNGVSVPSDFPFITITTNSNPDSGFIFIDNRGGNGTPYNVIFDNNGSPIWYQKMPDERRDMKVQRNGMLTMFARTGGNRFVGLNTNYVEVNDYWAVNGHETDEHELVVQPDGHFFLIGLHQNTVDMSKYVSGGLTTATVGETVLQEFTPAGELIFQWRAWDHYDIRDLRLDSPTASSMRFPHMNAIEIDTDGHILVSCRHLSEVTKINRDTGEIIWRLGGAHSDFTFVSDSLNGFENQHSIRVVGTNRYTLFDNGDLHNPSVSRAVEYELDLTNHTARVVWQYPPTPTTSLYSFYMGNVQRLPNGNTLINWAVGNLPKLTEVRPNGTKAFEMNWQAGYEAYRVWRCPWQGVALKPNLIIETYPDSVVLLFNKFGDSTVSYYRIYGGTSPNPTQVLATSPVTMATLQNLQNNQMYYFRVTAVSTNGQESAASDEQSVLVNLVRPGQNMVLNPEFSLGKTSWIWTLSGTGAGIWNIVSGYSYFDLTSPGGALSDIQLRQAGMRLIQGSEYVFEFDAWSAAPRTIEARVGQDQSPFTAYKVTSPALTPTRTHFKYSFIMTNATDLNARIAFNMGGSVTDVNLDSVALYMVAKGDFDRDKCIGFDDLKTFTSQWLRQGTNTVDLNGDSKVDWADFSLLGGNWISGSTCP